MSRLMEELEWIKGDIAENRVDKTEIWAVELEKAHPKCFEIIKETLDDVIRVRREEIEDSCVAKYNTDMKIMDIA